MLAQTPEVTAPFQPLQWQIAPWRDKSPVLLLTGAAGGGKSQLAAEKVHGYMKHYPGACGIALRKAREYATASLVPMFQSVIGSDSSVRISEGRVIYENGSIIYLAGMKNKEQREALRSMRGPKGDPDIVWFEEANAFTRLDFDEAGGRLRGNAGGWTQMILTTNPDIPQHWIYTDLILGRQAAVYYSSARDNPTNPPSYFARLDAMVGVLRDRLRDGKWVRAEGVVYDEFEPSIHLIDPFPIPAAWTRFRVIDFGFTNPFVCQWWAVDPDGRLYLYREIHETQKLVEDLTPAIIRLSGGEHISGTIADHDAEDRATMEKHGIATILANKEVLRGIQVVKARLKVQADGKARMYILRDALVHLDGSPRDDSKAEDGTPVSTAGEMTAYSWAKFTDGKPNKEEPVKMFDHHMDPTRYISMHLENFTPLPNSQPGQKSKWLAGSDDETHGWTRLY